MISIQIAGILLSSMVSANAPGATPPDATPTPALSSGEPSTSAPTAPEERSTIAACQDARLHQFDFWIGDWDVFSANGDKLGENHISVVNKGCTLAEHWTNSSGGEGRSYNAFDVITQRWYQFWSDDQGSTLSLSGALQAGSMVLEGERPNPTDGKPQKQRISWTPNADGCIRQHWETSDDHGGSWQTAFDGVYRRKTP